MYDLQKSLSLARMTKKARNPETFLVSGMND